MQIQSVRNSSTRENFWMFLSTDIWWKPSPGWTQQISQQKEIKTGFPKVRPALTSASCTGRSSWRKILPLNALQHQECWHLECQELQEMHPQLWQCWCLAVPTELHGNGQILEISTLFATVLYHQFVIPGVLTRLSQPIYHVYFYFS